jgi:putrescine transport system permease protein
MKRSSLTLVDRMTIAIPFAWLATFLALPLVSVAALSLHVVADSIPPVAPFLSAGHGHLVLNVSLRGFRMVTEDPLYLAAFWNGLENATLTAVGCILIGFPLAFAIARSPARRRNLYVLLAILPFWTSFLLRAYAWMGLIRDSGPINAMLLSLGIVHHPVAILYTPTGVLLVMIYSYLPFFVLPMYAVLEKLPGDLLAAASDLGARPAYVFRTVTLPLSLPGIVSGAILVFVPAVGEYVIPELVGNSSTMMIGGILWDEFFQNRDWPLAASIALVTFGLLMLPALALRRRLGHLGTVS